MPVENRDRDILEHILRYCEQIETAHRDFYHSRERFNESTTYQNAVSMLYPSDRRIGRASVG